VLQAVLRLFFLALIVHTVGRLLRRERASGPGGISQATGPDRVKTPRDGPFSAGDIVDGEFVEIPASRDSEPAC